MTVAAISAATGAPSGSIYHRFGSRDMLLARLWVRTVAMFQQGFLAALAQDDVDRAAIDAALHVVRWARDHPTEASVLLLRRRSELADRWPDELGAQLDTLESAVADAVADQTRRRYGSTAELARVRFAIVDIPYAACRRSLLAGQPLPPELDDLVVDTAAHVLGTVQRRRRPGSISRLRPDSSVGRATHS